MADTLKDLNKVASDSRSRIIIIVTGVVLAIAVVVGYVSLRSNTVAQQAGPSAVSGVPGGLKAIPGGKDTTPQYVKLQTEANITDAKKAMRSGQSFIPTIVGQDQIGSGAAQQATGSGAGFATLARQEVGGTAKNLWFNNLKRANCSTNAIGQAQVAGLSVSDISTVCKCDKLWNANIPLAQLAPVCSCPVLAKLGAKPRQFTQLGYSVRQLRDCGYCACDMRQAGYSAIALKDAGYTNAELRGGCYADNEINAATGVPDGTSAAAIRDAGCSPEALRSLRAKGVSAAAIRRISGCSASAMRAAGYTAKELKDAGFTAAELKKAGFSAKDLKDAGYTAQQLAKAGFSAKDLAAAGFSKDQIDKALAAAGVKQYSCSEFDLRRARANGVTAREIREKYGCSAAQMKAAGYTAKELKDAGFTAAELKKAGFSAKDLKDAGFSARQLKDAGFSAKDLKDAGFSARDLKNAGFSAKDLKDAGFSAAQLKNAGFSAKALKDAGFSARDLKNAGFSAKDLKNAGFSAAQLKNAGYNAKDLLNAGFTPSELKKAGFSAAQLKNAGLSASQLAEAGFSPEQLRKAGFTSNQLRAAGIMPATIGTDADLAGQDPASRAIRAALERQEKQMNKQQLQQQLQAMQTKMRGAASNLVSQWTSPVSQVYIAGTPPPEPKDGQAAGAGAAGASSQANASGANGQTNPLAPAIKAGTITYAVLETAVNSDEPGPVIARVVAGDLIGAKLIGSMTVSANAQKGTVQFNQLSLPDQPKVINISAFAIDPKTARTAIASRVNNHYLMRYGSLFASSFLQGVGQAIQQQGQSISTNDSSTTVENANRSPLENAIVGLGKVGQAWGAQVAPLFARPATIYVFSGTDIGVLFTADTSLPVDALDNKPSLTKIVKGM